MAKLWQCAAAAAAVLALAGCPGPSSPKWEPAFDASASGWLLSVWGPAADDLYAVGGAPDTGVIMHRDASGWTPLDPGIPVPLLNWCFGFGPDNVFMVGNGGTVLHWNGSSWELMTTPTDQDLWGIWGASPTDMWAVGGSGRADGDQTILRYDGMEWTAVPVPALSRPRVFAFFKVWGSSADSVFIVGQSGAVLRWDGSELSEQPVTTAEDMISVWGTGPDHVAAVGGRSNGVVATWDGSEWHTEQLAPTPGLNGVWMRSPDVIHIAGAEGTLGTVDFATRTVEENRQGTRLSFHALFGDPSGTITAVGGNFLMPMGPYMGIASTRRLRANE